MIKKEYLENVALTEVKRNPKNPRNNDDAVSGVQRSIEHNGFLSPMIVDENNVILAGDTRYKALIKAGQAAADIIRVTGLSPEQKEDFMLADNKTHEVATWAWEKLAEIEEERLRTVGFTEDEILRGFGLNEVSGESLDFDRTRVIEVDLPGAVKLKSRNCFYCESEEEFKTIQGFFKTDREGVLDKERLMAFVRSSQ
jgi:ParB-like chromosome segregation protein Spo0J